MLKIFKNNNFKICAIILISLIIDNLIILNIDSPPAWDQGYHLSNVFKMYNILGDSNLNFINKILSKGVDTNNSLASTFFWTKLKYF